MLEIMSKKRIQCLLADKQMTSSSGTEESEDDEDESSDAGEYARPKFALKGKKHHEAKFKPIGPDSGLTFESRARAAHEEPNRGETVRAASEEKQYDSNNEVEAGEKGSEAPSGATKGDALAAAGFKKSIVKKSISIKIKSSEQGEGTSSSGQLTDVQKQQQALSNKMKQMAKKQKEEAATTAAAAAAASKPQVDTQPQLGLLHQQINGSEKLHAQYSQYQSSLGGILNQPPLAPVAGSGLLPTPGLLAHGAGHLAQPPPFMQTPPSNFGFPPPSRGSAGSAGGGTTPGSRPMIQGPPPNLAMMHPHAQIVGALPLAAPPPNTLPGQQPPPGFHQMLGSNLLTAMAAAALAPPGTAASIPAPIFNGAGAGPNIFAAAGFNPMLGADKMTLGMGPDSKMAYPFPSSGGPNDMDDDQISINDDTAYDLDDEDDDEAQFISANEPTPRRRNEPRHGSHRGRLDETYDGNYDLDEMGNLNELMSANKGRSARRDRERDRERDRRDRNKSSGHRRHHHRNRSEDEEAEQEASRHNRRSRKGRKHQQDQELESIKDMLRGVLEAHIGNLDDGEDDELRATLESLLEQVTDDDGSLTYEDCVNIHNTVKSLLSNEEENDPDEVAASDDDHNTNSRKKRHRRHSSASVEEERNNGRKSSAKKKKSSKRRSDRDEADVEISRLNAEVEAGEIDDVYDEGDEVVVEKELQDLLYKKAKPVNHR